jgi:hypothetical protein
MIDLAASADPELRRLLTGHPKVARVEESNSQGIDFQVGSWHRSVEIASPSLEVAGLVELIDNNPMVCADRMSVPDPVSTLALVALGPLAWAGMILEPPTVICSADGDSKLLNQFMTTAGWSEGVTFHVEKRDLGSVLAITAMAAIATPSDWNDIDELFAERFSRSFYVRRDEESDWDPSLVAGKAHALYRLRYTPGEGESLLTIQALADLQGKCGPAQVVHAMNVMAGFEESLGVVTR